VAHLPRRAIIDQASCEAVAQHVPALRGFQHDRATSELPMLLIERRNQGSVKEVWEEHSRAQEA
jgi:hypothetical protein